MASMNFKNNSYSTISMIAQGGLTLTVTDATKFPTTVPFIVTVWDNVTYDDVNLDPNMEVMLVTAVTGANYTVTRGLEGTTDVAHAGGVIAEMLITAGHMNDATYGIVTKLDAAVDVTAAQIATRINASTEVFNDANIAATIARDSELHNELHTVASHSDTTATGVELETLTDGSNADSLHAHAVNDAKVTNVSTNLAEGTSTETTVLVTSSDGTDATLVSASTLRAGLLTKAKFDEIVANTLKNTNVSTALSLGTVNGTTVSITSDGGADDVTIPAATTTAAGLLTAALFDEIDANTAKVTNVSTNLAEGTSTETTVLITSSDGTDATLVAASTSRAGLLTKAKFDEIVANSLKPTLEEIQDNLGGTEGGDGDGFIKTADGHLTVTYSDTTPSLTLQAITTICTAPTGIEFGNASQEYDVDGETWVTAVAGGALGGVPNAVAGHELANCLVSIGTAFDSKRLVVRELTGAASATNPMTVQFLFSGMTTFSSINTRSYYHGSVSHDVSMQLWNFTTLAWDTYADFSGESDFVIRDLEVLSVANYISGGVTKLQFIHTTAGTATHHLEFDYVVLCDGGGGSGTSSIASAVSYTPTGNIASTNVQTAINELDTEKAPALTADQNYVSDAELVVVQATSGANTGDDPADDTAYNATSWDANADSATKNAIRDKVETMDTAIGLNTAKVTNVSTNLSEGTSTVTTVDVNSSDGTNATLLAASTSRAGLLTKAKFDEIVANNAKLTNATHTGDVNGSGALTLDKTAITGQNVVTADGADYVLISDTGDTGNLKKALVSDFGGTDSVATKTTTYQATTSDNTLFGDATSAAFTITLPAVSGNTGVKLRIGKTDSSANAVTIDGSGAETINGDLTIPVLGQWDMYTVQCNGTSWNII